ncbi:MULTISPECIES: Bax inhibitor-1/YccA family protein [unclassified Paracoccus (in: a-proteobacteria)]|uniref:Bax inhibitor-1/YccA family protein n=1 Tax=unclassified Paracoccus (in: a-proteobacteria) TaxID=2688777 RepID=UPI0012B1E0FE|nr:MULTISPECIES: Bax inhibitor-1/YccA family protein [unclassified Paracoccus (in: a-proteobacteria)]UXU74784.1 Bax inhibitor-1/YccA family protein [Paracoccus sp. SMMA_5]UXU80681.1 Bax inhibitor-1/YccA family protein [Paracoccus sp. SMMA_5_TC]
MQDYNSIRTAGTATRSAAVDEGLRAYMNKVYGLMAVAMLVTAGAAWGIAGLAQNPDGTLTALGAAIYTSPLRWVIMFAPLLVVFAFGAAVNRLSVSAATTLFYFFAALMGLSISWIFMVYTSFSIVQTFLVTAIAFAGLSLYGYTTKRDLSGMGTFLLMGLIGLIVASIVNIFLKSSAMQFAISVIGVLIFAGLTAFDTQNIKNTYLQLANSDRDFLGKSAIMGALQLYLDFLNLFMFLLQFMGNRE